jgi:ribonuclease III
MRAPARRLEPQATAIEEAVGYRFSDTSLLDAALAHSSSLPRGVVRAGEQLEFLGDAVVDLAVADLLLVAFPDAPEGVLSKCRARMVCTASLAAKARELGIGAALRLGRGEERSGGRDKDSILAAAYESVIGAIYRDAGFFRTRAVIRRHFKTELSATDVLETRDWKTQLQERTQARWRVLPEYRVVAEEGPAHARRFRCEVWVEGELLATGAGSSKREAEQDAAASALLAER